VLRHSFVIRASSFVITAFGMDTVNPSPSRTPYAWVQKRDGRVEPFDADKISRALFAAGESLGRPDAFLARELTDGILHFLAAESLGTPPSTAQITDVVIKVVRELGHPALSREFARGGARDLEDSGDGEVPGGVAGSRQTAREPSSQSKKRRSRPVRDEERSGPSLTDVKRCVENSDTPALLRWHIGAAALRDFGLREVFSRDLVAAHQDGLLNLTGLESPLGLAGCVLPSWPPRTTTGISESGTLMEAFEQAQRLTTGFVVVDAPEYAVALLGEEEGPVVEFTRIVALASRMSLLPVVLNLNCRIPPPWAEQMAGGPLYTSLQRTIQPKDLISVSDRLLASVVSIPGLEGHARINLHLAEDDLIGDARQRLWGLVRQRQQHVPVTFVFDRTGRAIQLAEGIDRSSPAVLIAVGIDLTRLAGQQESNTNRELFVQKLGSLARLALSAAAQKRDFLKKHAGASAALNRGFLIDRARTVIVPLGLDAVTRTLVGQGICASMTALDFAKSVLQRLDDALQQDGPSYLLNACLDAMPEEAFALERRGPNPESERRDAWAYSPAALGRWDVSASAREQLRAAGALHGVAGRGTAAIHLSDEEWLDPKQQIELLQYAWQHTQINCVRFVRKLVPERQGLVNWDRTVV
jgi:hypothetical protein